MSNSQLSGAKDGSRHGVFQPTSEPKDLLINTTVRFWKKKKKLQNEKKEKGGALRNVKYDTWTRNGLRNKILICVIASWIQPFPTLYPACSSEWTLHSIWHCWLPANHFNGVQTKISSLIIIMALNMNYGRGISTVAMVSNYKWFVLEVENLPNLSC